METPQVRPGKVSVKEPVTRVIAYFYNSAQGNSAIQLLVGMGIPSDQIGVTPPEQIEKKQGMLLSIPCSNDAFLRRVEALCRSQGAEIRRQKPR
jgi:hypothetical protein